MKRALTALCLVFGLSGCAGHSPMTYLVLSPASGPIYAVAGTDVAVGRVSMPPAIDRSFLTTGSGENTLDINYNAQWAAPLEPMAQITLARDLAARLPGHTVLMPGDNVPDDALIISVNIITFLPYADHVVLAADWRASGGKNQPVGGRVNSLVSSGPTAQDQAQALSQALGQLADKIAEKISR